MSNTTEKVIDAAANVVGEVAEQTEGAEEIIRSLSQVKVTYASMGLAVGAAAGALIAFKVAYTKAETKYNQIADDEISEMREHYREKALALESEASKEDLETIVRERGYSVPDEAQSASSPMAVAPPARVVEEVKEEIQDAQPSEPKVRERNVFEEHAVSAEVASWDQEAELRLRTPDAPYVIHYDERHEFDDYEEVTLTYFTADDVLCRDHDEVVDPVDRERLIGEMNLERFGHGSNDHNVVYVRNDKLEMVFEIIRSNNSFAEEVHGLTHHSGYGRNLERMRARERRGPDDD